MTKDRNHISTHLLHLAEEDNFRSVLHILLTAEKYVNFNARTKDGDYLITLLAYATCERNSGVQLYALKCLKWVLNRDFTAVNKVAGDGGSVLHCSLAAASCLDENEEGNSNSVFSAADESDEDSDSDDSDDDSCEYDSDEDSATAVSKDFIQQINRDAASNFSVDEFCGEFSTLTSGEITVAAIQLLLSHEADVNLPLANIYGLTHLDDEDDELELTYSREATIQQWTPLMFALQWLLLDCSRLSRCSKKGEILEKALCIPLSVIILLLNKGADPSYMIAGEESWNVMQILASANHILAGISVNAKVFSKEINAMHAKVGMTLSKGESCVEAIPGFQNLEGVLCISDLLETILRGSGDECVMSPVQIFAAAIMANDSIAAESILKKESDRQNMNGIELLKDWRAQSFEEILPTLEAVWNNASLRGKTVLDLACSCFALNSVTFMTENTPLLEYEIRHGIISVFEDLGGRSDSNTKDENAINLRVKRQSAIIKTILENQNHEKNRRQKILDQLLLESCAGKMWTLYSPHSTSMLLQFGADPNIASIVDEIYNALTPLHLIAGNCRGTSGLEKIVWLLEGGQDHEFHTESFQSADLFAVTTSSHQMPIDIALEKKNFKIAGKLLEAMGEENIMRIDWTIDKAILIGEVAIETASTTLFEQAINLIVASCSKGGALDKRAMEKSIGGLLVSSMDRRSGFGKTSSVESSMIEIVNLISKVADTQQRFGLMNLASWARDEISGHNCLHLILRDDRGFSFRSKVLEPMCELVMKNVDGSKLLSQPCSSKFGGFTPLHLACAMGCEYSMKTLIRFGANWSVLDTDKKTPKELIPDNIQASEEIWALIP